MEYTGIRSSRAPVTDSIFACICRRCSVTSQLPPDGLRERAGSRVDPMLESRMSLSLDSDPVLVRDTASLVFYEPPLPSIDIECGLLPVS